MFRVILAMAFLVACLAACAPIPPNRTGAADPTPDCAAVFEAARPAQKTQEPRLDLHAAGVPQPVDYSSQCWKTSHEYTCDYDLFLVEFDDHGWLSKYADEPARIRWVLRQLNAMVEKDHGSPLNLIVYTHGWHHSAAPDDRNVNAFRNLLGRAALLERYLDERSGKVAAQRQGAAAPQCAKARRRVAGVYIAWRGDSLLGPGAQYASIWDRKLVAEEVAQGAVQELFASLHNFYLAHACHLSEASDLVIAEQPPPEPEKHSCNDVQMLTIGHSFGALITYRALAGRLMANIAESPRRWANPHEPPYAHSFGDLVVLINPAFEGVHFEALARAAAERSYQAGLPGQQGQHGAQLPILIILQSEGDGATKNLFPAFRRVTTIFSPANGEAQAQSSLHGVGWTDRYLTHWLETDSGFDPACHLVCQLEREQAWRKTQKDAGYSGFGEASLSLGDGLVLKRCRVDHERKRVCGTQAALAPAGQGLERPAYMPVWVVRTTKEVIRDHNDFLNAHLVTFIRHMYHTVLEEAQTNSPQ